MFISMFKDEIAPGVKNVLFHNLVRKCLKIIQGIRWVCEDDVELLTADRKKVKHIVPDHCDIVKSQAGRLSLYEGRVLTHHLYTIDTRSSA